MGYFILSFGFKCVSVSEALQFSSLTSFLNSRLTHSPIIYLAFPLGHLNSISVLAFPNRTLDWTCFSFYVPHFSKLGRHPQCSGKNLRYILCCNHSFVPNQTHQQVFLFLSQNTVWPKFTITATSSPNTPITTISLLEYSSSFLMGVLTPLWNVNHIMSLPCLKFLTVSPHTDDKIQHFSQGLSTFGLFQTSSLGSPHTDDKIQHFSQGLSIFGLFQTSSFNTLLYSHQPFWPSFFDSGRINWFLFGTANFFGLEWASHWFMWLPSYFI